VQPVAKRQLAGLLAIVGLFGALLAEGLWAQGESDSARPQAAGKLNGNKANGKAKNRQPLAVTPEREAAVMTFVERNHAELSGLLAHLKENQPRQYEQAVKEIYRVTERLATVQERDPLLYELEVKVWTAQSQVQLLAARLKMGDTQEQRRQLREALAAQIEARLAVLKHQRDASAQRLARMDEQISKIEADRDATIERQLELLAKSGDKARSKNASGKRAAKVSAERKDKKVAD
jgi:hypothetical protein